LPIAPVGLTLQTGEQAAGSPTTIVPPTLGGVTNAPPTVGTASDVIVTYSPSVDGESLYNHVAIVAGYADYTVPNGKFAGCIWPWITGRNDPNTANLSGYNQWDQTGRREATIIVPGALIDACGR
jgi:hypothetical protein